MWDSVKALVGNVAPMLGSLLGGSGGEKVGQLIAGALGVAPTPKAITEALEAHPELLLELQRFEHEHRTQLTQLQLTEMTLAAESETRHVADVQDAREKLHDHVMVSVLTVALLLMTAGIAWVVVREAIPEGNRDMVMFIFGQIIGFTASVVNFWLGSSPKGDTVFKKGKV